VGKLPILTVFGNDYDTPDGTCLRDYIHVVDLARGHINAVEKTLAGEGEFVYNLGTGEGYSVLNLVHAFMKVTGVNVNYRIGARREGDLAVVYSDPSRALNELGWKAQYGIEDMCRDTWKWQSQNPNGYGE
jgi:UDP-glucose 4-epimerase